MPGGMVGGHKFTDINDYNAALEDTRLINRLRSQINMSDPDAVRKLYRSLQTGEVRFRTVVGRDFDDELYDLIQKLDSGEAASEPEHDAKKSKRAKSAQKTKDAKPEKKQKAPKASRTAKTSEKTDKSGKTATSRKERTTVRKNAMDRHAADDIDAVAAEILRKANRRNRIISICAGVVAAGSLIIFMIYSKSAYENQAAMNELAALKGTDPVAQDIEQKPVFTLAEDEKMPPILDEYKNVYIKNKSVIGWLTIDGTNIDYPVMQTVNNDYYLNHNFEGKEDNNGSIFMDCNCDAVFRTTNMIIYGHHMKSGKMFGNLKKYESEDYCKEHNLIKFDTIYEKGLYEVMYVFRDTIKDAGNVGFKYYQFFEAASEEEFDSNMKAMAEMSLYDTGVTAKYGDELLTLSTCNGSTSTARFVVVAKRVPQDQVTYVYGDEQEEEDKSEE
ncbi:MAG: class B sortase [Lachnospiraceae bacterium]|nr:class B sortase [Lachnospiraceae bacterium]